MWELGGVAQLVERSLSMRKVGGSIPLISTFAYLAQLVERKTFNLVVVGSSPTVGISLVDLINSDEKVSFVIVF